jgi:biofilm protein TabA
MLYESSEGVYVFCYDCIQDFSSISDHLHNTIEDAEDFCMETYNIQFDNWISISDPLQGCQHDFILPTKVKEKENGKPEWIHFQSLINNRWVDIGTSDHTQSFDAMTVNERLFISGLMDEFDASKIGDKTKAKQILRSLQVDEPSIALIIK